MLVMLARFFRLSPTLLPAILVALVSVQSYALTLGKLRVLSGQGQPLLAELDIASITTEQAASLRVGVASPESFRAAGLEYNAQISGLAITGKRRSDGRAYLELRTAAPVNDPYLDLVLEFMWANNGRMVRDYTLLIDAIAKPASPQASVVARSNLPVQTAAPDFSFSTPLFRSAPAPAAPQPGQEPANAPGFSLSTGAAAPVAHSPGAAQPKGAPSHTASTEGSAPGTLGYAAGTSFSFSTRSAPGGSSQYKEPTQTAGLALQRQTNRSSKRVLARSRQTRDGRYVTRSGDAASAIAQTLKPAGISLDQMLLGLLASNPSAFIAGDINRLKAGVVLQIPTEKEMSTVSSTQAREQLQASAVDFNAYRQKLAQSTPAHTAAQNAREVKGSVSARVEDKRPSAASPDKLTLSKGEQSPNAAAVSQEARLAAERTQAEAQVRQKELQKNIEELGRLTPPTASPSAPSASATSSGTEVAKAGGAATQPAQSTFKTGALIDRLVASAWTLPVAAGLAVLLALVSIWRLLTRRRTRQTSTTHIPFGDTPVDLTQGTAGATLADATQGDTPGPTMIFPPTQLVAEEATGDVDPISEAEVYLAYNRDFQAEEILREALQVTPQRQVLYTKLLGIYAKRKDVEAFDSLAQELHTLSGGTGPQWSDACNLARDIGSKSPLFEIGANAFGTVEGAAVAAAGYTNQSLSFIPNEAFVNNEAAAPPKPHDHSAVASAATHSSLMDFDLSGLSLDIPATAGQQAPQVQQPESVQMFAPRIHLDPEINPKIALAEEYLLIGDKSGARALLDDVIRSGASQDMQLAQEMLGRVG